MTRVAAAASSDPARSEPGASIAQGRLAAFVAHHPTLAIGSLLLGAMVFIALFAPYLGTIDPSAISPVDRALPPSAAHWFGTDLLGRDVYSRVLYGARVSLIVGISVAALASISGAAIGLVSSFVRWLDPILMRIIDGMMSIPAILLAIALLALAQGSIQNVVVAITFSQIGRVARLVRGDVLSLRERAYVEAAVAAGASSVRIMRRHILPNIMAPLMVQASFICADAMLIEAVLSFIGAGTPPTLSSWGATMSEGRTLWQVRPHVIFFPAVFLSVTVLAINLGGDGSRDMLDPHTTRTSR